MKQMAKWLVLCLALLVCIFALWGCGKPQEDAQSGKQGDTTLDLTDDETLPVTGSDTIECCDGNRTLRFTRDETDHWVWKDDSSFPLDETYVTELLATAQEILALTPVKSSGELSDYGLNSDEKYIKLTGKSGEGVTFYLGDLTSEGCYYMRRGGEEELRIYVAPTALTEQISRSIYDMALLPELPALTAENVESITISTAGDAAPIRLHADDEGKWFAGQVTDMSQQAAPLMEALAAPELDACVDYQPSAGAAAVCGLQTPQTTMTVEYVNTVGIDSTFILHVGAQRSDGTYYAAINDDTTIYAIDGSIVAAILAVVQ